MKTLILSALTAFICSNNVVVSTPEKVVVVSQDQFAAPHYQGQHSPVHYGFYGPQGNVFDVAHYLAYQFHQAQEQGYTGAQVSHYFVEHGFPESVAKYLAKQYETGLSLPYFESPYHIFHYYSEHNVPEEVQQYISQHIAQAYQQLQRYFSQYGSKAFKQEHSGVPQPFYHYVADQARYYGEHGVSHSAAHNAYQHLQMAYRYAQNALHYFVSGQVSQEAYHQVYEFLQQGLQEIHSIQSIPQSYLTYHQYYVPYYVAQYNLVHAQKAYQHFLHAYEYVQEHAKGVLPESFVQYIQYAYFAAENAYHFYEQSHSNSEYSSNHYLAVHYYQQVVQYIESVQKYIQNENAFSQASNISQQLNQSHHAYQLAYMAYHQQQLARPVVSYIQQGYHYLVVAYEAAQHSGQQYVIQQLKHAVHAAGNLLYIAQSFFGAGNEYYSHNPSDVIGNNYYYGSYKPYSSDEFYGPHSPSAYGSYVPHGPSFAYEHESYVPSHGSAHEYGPYSSSSVSGSSHYTYGGVHSSSLPYEHGSYVPSHTSAPEYGPYTSNSRNYPYGTHSSSFAYEHGRYVPSQGSAHEYGPHSSSSVSGSDHYPYGPYSNSYSYGAYGYQYTPYGSDKDSGYPHHYGHHYGQNAHSESYIKSAAAAA